MTMSVLQKKKRNESDDPVHRDLVSGLRGLGYRAAEAKRAADHAMRTEGSLESRMRAALNFFQRRPAVTRTEPAREEATAGTGRPPAIAACV